jgi:hypothetical protein
MKKNIVTHIGKTLLLGITLLGFFTHPVISSAQSLDMDTDFKPQSSYNATGGSTLDIEAVAMGSFLSNDEDIFLTVTFEMVDFSGSSVFSQTLQPIQITENWFSITVSAPIPDLPFTLPNDPSIANQSYWVNIHANYTYTPTNNFQNYTLTTSLNNILIFSDNTLTGTTSHLLEYAFRVNYTYDPCASLSVSLSENLNKSNRLRATAQAQGGSGNYSYSWQVTPTNSNSAYTAAGSYIDVSCGCVDAVLTVTDNETGCQKLFQRQICAPTECVVRIQRFMRRGFESEAPDLVISPNPASAFLSISTDYLTSSSSIRLYEINGKVVLQQKLNSGVQRIDLSGIKPGVYCVALLDEQGVAARKKVVIR